MRCKCNGIAVWELLILEELTKREHQKLTYKVHNYFIEKEFSSTKLSITIEINYS
jgi:hypothetical protein